MVTNIAIALIALSAVGLLGVIIYYKLIRHKYRKNSALYNKDKLVVKEKRNYKDMFDKSNCILNFYQNAGNKILYKEN